ncbi:MAG: hypothetical protein WC878_07405 [Candidatus Paceibacterota bacterium]|jgi:hypothetical protein
MPAYQNDRLNTRTFGELRSFVLARTNSENHFVFCRMGKKYEEFWSDMNGLEYDRGYDKEEYEKKGSPALCDMKLLTESEFDVWKQRFLKFHK